MTPQSFKKFMLFWAMCFLIGGLLFIAAPHSILWILHIPQNSEYFWVALAGSMMITVSYLCYEAYQNPFNTTAILGVLIAKAASSLFFIVSALRTHNAIYLLGTVMDGFIFLVILLSYKNLKPH